MAFDAEIRAALIEQVRRFVTEKCVPIEAQVGEEDEVPQDVVDEMKALGLFGIAVPEEYGGLALDMETECLVALELGQTSPAFRSVAGTNIGIGSQALVLFGTEEQKSKWLPGIASGDLIASFALTEPEAGSDAAGLKTKAIKDGDHYVLNGTKRYITNANKADLFTVMARTDPDTPGAKGVSAFIVERDTPGVTVGVPEKKMGQQGAHICDVIFEDARVPAANMIAGEGEGFKVAMSASAQTVKTKCANCSTELRVNIPPLTAVIPAAGANKPVKTIGPLSAANGKAKAPRSTATHSHYPPKTSRKLL